jgi:hypothetical protein
LAVAIHAFTKVKLDGPIDQCQDFTTESAISLYLLGIEELVSPDVGDPSTDGFMNGAVGTKDESQDQSKGADEFAEFVHISGGSVFDFGATRHIRIG